MDWERLFRQWRITFYTPYAILASALIFIIAYSLRKQKAKSSIYLFIISVSSFLQISITALEIVVQGKHRYHIDQKSMYFYLIIEVFCCAWYIKENIRRPIASRIIAVSAILFSVYTLIYFAKYFTSKYLPSHIENLDGLLLLLYSLYYLYYSFIGKAKGALVDYSAFWAVSGMLFLSAVTTPLFLIFNYLRELSGKTADRIYIINNLCYVILFIFFTISLWGKHTKVKVVNK